LKRTLSIAVLLTLVLVGNVRAVEAGYPEAGLDERPGSVIPLDLTFQNEEGKNVVLKELIDRPTVLMLVYYDCSHICPQMLGGLAKSLGDLQLVPGKDYRVITVSFDDTEKPEEARTQKRNYIRAINRPFPEDAWRFLTGDRDNIRRLSDAVGIRYKNAEHGFIHPEVLVFVSPRGLITRYMHVPKFNYGVADPMVLSSLGLKNAFLDASMERVSTGGSVTPMYCFLHEPANQERFYNMLKVSGTLTVLALFFLFVYLKGRRRSAG
jgi:protein SCO1/2